MTKKHQGLRFQNNREPNTSKTIPVGKKQRLTIERLAHDGRGIAKLQNKTWFVAGVLPHEEVETRVVSSQSKWVNAKCEHVITPSSRRQTPACEYSGICGGCELQHIAYDEQIKFKQTSVIEQLQRFANIQVSNWQPPLVSEPFGYRRRARIAVHFNEQTQQLDVGFRAAFSQQIISIKDCLVLTDPLRDLLRKLPECLKHLDSPHYIGHLELFSGNHTALLVRHTKALSDNDTHTFVRFCQANHCKLWFQGKDKPMPVGANDSLSYQLMTSKGCLNLDYQIGDFIQVNAKVNQAMISQALEWLKIQPDTSVLDLFSGLGNFTLPIATLAKQVTAIEVIESMVEHGKQNAIKNNLTNTVFYQSDLSQPIHGKPWARETYSIVLLDPPRDGATEIINQMKKLDTNRILYVSCNPATLARDSKQLIEQGYQIKKAGIMDMFPQTSHIETMVLFER